MPYALIVADRVVDVFAEAPELHPDLEVVEVDAAVVVGAARKADKTFAPPPPPPSTAEVLTAYVAAKRYELEIAGVTVTIGSDKGVPMSTRREDRDGARDTLSAIREGWRQDGSAFKFADGISRAATNDEMKMAIGAAFAHVQAAFDLEREAIGKTRGAKPSITDFAGVDAAFAAAV